MPSARFPAGRALGVAALVSLTLLMSGCEVMSDWLRGRSVPAEAPADPDAPRTNDYLAEMYALASGDPATQAEIYADARSAATITPGPSTELRYALVLATPGHSETDSAAAQSLFRELLAETELLTPTEIALATIHLEIVEARLVLDAEARRLRDENARAASTENAAVARRIAAVEAENRELSRSLADALSKLEALSAIERSMRQQAENE